MFQRPPERIWIDRYPTCPQAVLTEYPAVTALNEGTQGWAMVVENFNSPGKEYAFSSNWPGAGSPSRAQTVFC